MGAGSKVLRLVGSLRNLAGPRARHPRLVSFLAQEGDTLRFGNGPKVVLCIWACRLREREVSNVDTRHQERMVPIHVHARVRSSEAISAMRLRSTMGVWSVPHLTNGCARKTCVSSATRTASGDTRILGV